MPEFREALRLAIAEEMQHDERVILIGEDVAAAGGVFKVTEGLHERFGSARVIDTPISELALSSAAFGAAVAGCKPIVEIMFGDFMALPMDALVNQAAKYWYLSVGRNSVPLVVRTAAGAGGRFGAIHSQSPGTWLHGVPGLKVVCPSCVADARALLKAAIRDPNPVVFIEHKRLYAAKGELGEELEPLGKAQVVRVAGEGGGGAGVGGGAGKGGAGRGGDVTIATVMKGVPDALAAAEQLAKDGIEVEVIDLRSLRPLDVETVAESVARTHRLLAVEEGPRTGGWAAGLIGAVASEALGEVDDLWTLCTPDTPIPFSPTLEDAFLPGADAIAQAIRMRFGLESKTRMSEVEA
ncbi:MAG TPA: transketolase C-terminal domain-containing protein [Solirubrobacteraceae bacterium]|jgi:pyruvate/2-oxoglutarate/acetoin dehydrogenase E1 component